MSQDKAKPAVSALGIALQAAKWMGQGPAPERSPLLPRSWPSPPAVTAEEPNEDLGALTAAETPEPGASAEAAEASPGGDDTAPASPSVAESLAPQDEPAGATPTPPPAAASTKTTSAAELPLSIEGDKVTAEIGDRRYEVRGLSRNKSHDIMKVSIKAVRDEAVHVDSLDLYSHRLRQIFQRAVADELALEEDVVKRDLGRLLLSLEKLRDASLKKTLEPKKERVEIPPERKLAALTRLRTKGLISWIDESLTLCGLVGERTNKVASYLACVSRLLDRPLAIIVQSSSAAGKSALMDAVLSLMPEEHRVKYSAMTGQSLYYLGESVDLRHRILAIAEEEGAARATYALKLLQSEGEISIISTSKDPQTGELRSKEYKVKGPVMIFLTTTAYEIDEELLSRCIVLIVDEGREQTRRIHEMQRQMMTLEGIVARKQRAKVMEIHQDVQRLLRPLSVQIPYAMRLTFPDHATRTRRDHTKYLELIQAVTLLHQYQREVKEVETEGGKMEPYIDATPEDVDLANEIANEVLGRSLDDELPPQTQVFLDQLHEMVAKACATRQIVRQDYRLTRREILDATRLSLTAVRRHLQRLVDYEYVLVHQGARGQTFCYELLYNGEALRRERFVMGLVDVAWLKAEAAAPRTTAEMAHLQSQLAHPWHTHGTPMAQGWLTPSDGGNGASSKGGSGFDPRSPGNAEGPRPKGDGRRSGHPPVVPGGGAS